MEPVVHKTKQPVEQKKETKEDLSVLKCPKLDLEGERKLVYGEGIALNSAKEFNKYIGHSIDRRGGEIVNAISTGAEQAMRDFGLAQTTKREILEQERHRQEMEMSTRSQNKKKTSIDLEEEEKLLRASRDEVRREIRQDLAGKGESDGSALGKAANRGSAQAEIPVTENEQSSLDNSEISFVPQFESEDDL